MYKEITKMWNVNQKILREIIMDESFFQRSKATLLHQHSTIHNKEIYGITYNTLEDLLCMDLNEEEWRRVVEKNHGSIARNLWHATRIEDMVVNVLIRGEKEVIEKSDYVKRLNSPIYDTGNSLNKEGIVELSKKLNIEEFKSYRYEVGKSTKEFLEGLEYKKLKEKCSQKGLFRLLEKGSVLKDEECVWLIDYWKKKNIASLLLMPVTRHNFLHLNKSLRIKTLIKKN